MSPLRRSARGLPGLAPLLLAGLLLAAVACQGSPAAEPVIAEVTGVAPLEEALPVAPEATDTATPRPTATTTSSPTPGPPTDTPTPSPTATSTTTPTATPTATPPFTRGPVEIGQSIEGRPIESYYLGYGPSQLVLVGGMHGGYEWNTILLAYELLDHFQEHPEQVPDAVTLVIVPNANPDGLFAVSEREGRFTVDDLAADTVPGRFNARGVDLNRNWDCNWAPTALWRNQTISAGEGPFSEPENQALRDFFLTLEPALVLFYHSAAEGVYAAGCEVTGPRSYELAGIYSLYSGYPRYASFDAYPITGDAGDWLAENNIASITVELTTHELTEFVPNLDGVLALLEYFAAEQSPATEVSPTAEASPVAEP